jgi:aspartate carbamoyltransferase catalytic subunit
MVCGPTTLMPKFIGALGVKVEHNLIKALNWCDVANMLRIQLERQDIKYFPSLREYTMLYGLNKQIFNSLDKEITVMHPGPINRGVEITSDVADSKQSIILDQVENGVAIRMAVLYLAGGTNPVNIEFMKRCILVIWILSFAFFLHRYIRPKPSAAKNRFSFNACKTKIHVKECQ